MFSTWSLKHVHIFRTNPNVSVHVATVLPPRGLNFLSFEKGGVGRVGNTEIARDFRRGSEPVATRISTRDIDTSSRFCLDHVSVCAKKRPRQLVLLVKDDAGGLVSSSYAVLDNQLLPLRHLRTLQTDSDQQQKLFAVLRPYSRNPKIYELSSDSTGRFAVDFSQDVEQAPWLWPYAVLVALLAGMLVLVLSSASTLNLLANSIRRSWLSFGTLAVWAVFCYALLFPGMFNLDHVTPEANAGRFNGWYSGIFFIYTSLIRIIGYNWLQLTPVVLMLLSFLIVLQTITFVCISSSSRLPGLFKAIFVLCIITNPAVFAVMFIHQRYFFVVPVASLATAIAFYAYAKELKFPETRSTNLYAAAFVLFVVAALLRTEYVVFAMAFSALLLFRTVCFARRQGNHTENVAKSEGIVFLKVLACVLCGAIFVGFALPAVYKYESKKHATRYLTVSSIGMAKPYVSCDGALSNPIEQQIERWGGMGEYCTLGSEKFWWRRANQIALQRNPAEMAEFNNNVKIAILADPAALLRDRFEFGQKMLTKSSMWQTRTTAFMRSGKKSGYYWQLADNYGLYRNTPLLDPLIARVVGWYASRGHRILLQSLIFVVTATVGLLIFCRAYVVGFATLVQLLVIIPVVFVAPSHNWAYLAYLPVWAAFAVPFGIIEKYARKHREDNRHKLVPNE